MPFLTQVYGVQCWSRVHPGQNTISPQGWHRETNNHKVKVMRFSTLQLQYVSCSWTSSAVETAVVVVVVFFFFLNIIHYVLCVSHGKKRRGLLSIYSRLIGCQVAAKVRLMNYCINANAQWCSHNRMASCFSVAFNWWSGDLCLCSTTHCNTMRAKPWHALSAEGSPTHIITTVFLKLSMPRALQWCWLDF